MGPLSKDEALLAAVARGDFPGVDSALAAGASLSAHDAAGLSALAIAARDGRLGIVGYLLQRGAMVEDDDVFVAGASADSSPTVVKLLQLAQIRQARPATQRCRPPEAALLEAAYRGDVAGIGTALAAGASVDARDDRGTSALRWAARRGHEAALRALLAAGATIGASDAYGWTALMEAVVASGEGCVELLLGRGANPNLETFAGATALRFAWESADLAGDEAAVLRIVAALEAAGAVDRPSEQPDPLDD